MALSTRGQLPTSDLYSSPYSLDPMPNSTKQGLYAVGFLACLSVASTFALLVWITYRLIFWRKHSRVYTGYNQNVILIFQLLLADLQQSIGFLLSFYWVGKNKIVGPSATCFAQAWFIHIGDISSGFFVLGIAIHTWISVVRGRKIPYNWFLVSVVGVWVASILLTLIGPAAHGRYIFLRAGSWCWISSDHETSRLTLHYLWIFIDEFGAIITYALVFWHLRQNFTDIVQSNIVSKATRCMVLYPLAYVVLTLPLATGRMAAMSGQTFPDSYYLVSGGLITSCGWVDCLLYTLTRRVILRSDLGNSGEPAPRAHEYSRNRHNHTYSRGSNAGGSTDSIITDSMRLGNIKAETKVEVTISDVEAVAVPVNAFVRSECASVTGPVSPTAMYKSRPL